MDIAIVYICTLYIVKSYLYYIVAFFRVNLNEFEVLYVHCYISQILCISGIVL